LQLHRDAGRAGGIYQVPAGRDDRARRGLGGATRRAGLLPGQRRWIGVEAETDLAAAFCDERSQTVGERLRAQTGLNRL
jgi:hypothetical protein